MTVVVGAGPNGLAAAHALARAGREVLVLEEREIAGGALGSAELTLPGFVHDVCSAVHPGAAASPAFESMQLERFGHRWCHPPLPLAHVLGGERAIAVHRDVGETAAGLDALGPGEGRAYAEALAPLVDVWDELRDIGLGPWPPLGATLRAAAALGRHAPAAARLGLGTAARAPLGPHGRALLAGGGLHGDRAPGESASGTFGVGLVLLAHAVGWPSPAGGSGALARALTAAVEAEGATLRTSCRADVIEVRDGAVAAVHAGGERIPCEAVVADVVPRELLRLCGAAFGRRARRALRRFRHADGAFKVDWALAEPIPWRAEAARRAGTVHVGGTVEQMARQTAQRRAGAIPVELFLLCGQQSLADPTRTPDGRQTAWAYTLVPARRSWTPLREGLADALEQRIEAFAPGFRERILARAIHDPDDLERHDRNLVGGDVSAGANTPRQLIARPWLRAQPYRTAIRGLVLASAATPPGGGVHGACGANAARALLDAS